MANRAYVFLENTEGTRFLCESKACIPDFWQCLWSDKELKEIEKVWGKYDELPDEELDAFLEEAMFIISVHISDFEQYAHKNRAYIATHFPEGLPLYDDFIAYIKTNVREGDQLNFDLYDIAMMDDITPLFKRLYDAQDAIRNNRLDKTIFSFDHKNLVAYSTGWADFFTDEVNPDNSLVNSLAYQQGQLAYQERPKVLQEGKKKLNDWLYGLIYLAIVLFLALVAMPTLKKVIELIRT